MTTFNYKAENLYKCNMGGIWRVYETIGGGSAQLQCTKAYKPEGALYSVHDVARGTNLLNMILPFDKGGNMNENLRLIAEITP